MNVYSDTTDEKIRSRALALHAKKVAAVAELGFTDLGILSELGPPLSAIPAVGAFASEAASLHSPLKICIHQPVLVHRDSGTYAVIFGLGVKFKTFFQDGSVLISANFNTPRINSARQKFQKYGKRASVADTWKLHRERLNKSLEQGLKPASLDFPHLIQMEHLEDARMAWMVWLSLFFLGAMAWVILQDVIEHCGP